MQNSTIAPNPVQVEVADLRAIELRFGVDKQLIGSSFGKKLSITFFQGSLALVEDA